MKITSVLITLLILCSLNSFSQDWGKLTIEIDFSDNRHHEAEGLLLLNDSLWSRHIFPEYSDEWNIDSIPAGVYKLIIRQGGDDYITFNQIKVRAEEVNTYHFNWSDYTFPIQDSLSEKLDFTTTLLYGNQNLMKAQNALPNEEFKGGFYVQQFLTPNKHYSLGFIMGGSLGYTNFNKDTTHFDNHTTISKYYSSLNYSMGLVNRFSFFDFTKYKADKSGLMIDIGAMYNFPLRYREVFRLDDNTKIQTKGIHNYLDFYGFARLAYKKVGLQAEYNPINYIIHGYAPNPPFRVGISFLFCIEE